MKALLDVNVVIALADTNHTYHQTVKSWYQAFISDKKNVWCSCAITELGVFRILSQPNYINRIAMATVEAWLIRIKTETRHEFFSIHLSLSDNIIDWRHLQGHRQLTDAYLLALAVANQAVFVTLDNRINYRTVKHAKPDNLLTLEL